MICSVCKRSQNHKTEIDGFVLICKDCHSNRDESTMTCNNCEKLQLDPCDKCDPQDHGRCEFSSKKPVKSAKTP